MRKILIPVLLVLLLSACETSRDDNGKQIEYGLNVMSVEGCKYVIYRTSGSSGVAMVHAGNCPNHKQF